jgi:hypothetical protein
VSKLAQKAHEKLSLLREKAENCYLVLKSRVQMWYTERQQKIMEEKRIEKNVEVAKAVKSEETRRPLIQAKVRRVQ